MPIVRSQPWPPDPNQTASGKPGAVHPEAARFGALAQRFATLVRGCSVDGTPSVDPAGERDIWLDAARLSDIPALETFTSGLERDGAAVHAALTTPWSHGQAEGRIGRLKMLKRTM